MATVRNPHLHDLCKTGGEVFTYENSIYEFDVWYIGSAEVREAVEGVLADSLDLPVISAVYSPALYVLALLVVAAYALSRKDALTLVVVLPCFVLLLTVLAGPLNGHLRYVLPLAAALPLLYACALRVPAKAPQG